MAALTVGENHPPLPHPQIGKAQAENFATAQPAEHHRGHHRPVPKRPQRAEQRSHLDRLQHPRQRPRGAYQQHAVIRALPLPPGRQPPRHRVHRNITTGQQIAVQPRHARQPAPSVRADKAAASPTRCGTASSPPLRWDPRNDQRLE